MLSRNKLPLYLHMATSGRCDVGLQEGEHRENCLSCSSVYYYNGAQRYEQFLQVSQLYRALILFSLALLSSERLCVFGLHGAIYLLNCCCLHPSLYLLVS